MQYVPLGSAGAKVSRIALGTMNFGPVIDEEESFAIMDRARAAGVTFFDNADVYGGPPWGDLNGQSEEIQGRWMASRGCRDELVVATKVHGTVGDGPNDRGLSAVHIRKAVEDSLRRLQTDRIDLYQMHHIVHDVPVDEILEAFSRLYADGKILYLGSSNFPGWSLARFREVAASAGLPRIVTEQSVYSLANRAVETEVIPSARAYGIGLLPWSPLAGGLLGGILAKQTRSRSRAAFEKLDELREPVTAYEELAAQRGIAPGTLALAWLLHQQVVTAPIVGPRTTAHLDDAIAALDIELDQDLLAELDRIWPGPGEAPESYAW